MLCWHALCPGCLLPAPEEKGFLYRKALLLKSISAIFLRALKESLVSLRDCQQSRDVTKSVSPTPTPLAGVKCGETVEIFWKLPQNPPFPPPPLLGGLETQSLWTEHFGSSRFSSRLLLNYFGAPGLDAHRDSQIFHVFANVPVD